jgi:hypothetical protein
MIPQVVASEKGRAQTRGACSMRVVGPHLESILKPNCLERQATQGESPVGANVYGRGVS